ncbi:TrkA-N domain dehydrogenase [Cordyceps javanica]|uniref:TrkA-N domain dehydrogenase n=1 Tax=Cordyceps javanica TaxID=43265 RepID=A0A545UZ34_9HYPO|nr:TrkA-N domain dehydrogenase [Cordyceps javanica]TQW06611.1 TrkA-N domain dehydrogenase [Cordyceps javanica]
MHIYITGGSGRNGSLSVAAALERGHTVTALVRDAASLPARANLTVVEGSPLRQADVERALTSPARADAVLVTLGLARTSGSPFAPLRPDTTPDFMSRAVRTLLAAVDAVFLPPGSATAAPADTAAPASTSAPKLILNSTLGAGDSWSALSWPFRLLFSQTPMRFGVADHNLVDHLVRGSGRRFVLARAGRLTEQKKLSEPSAPVRVLPDNGKGLGLADALTRQSLAQWLVLAAEQDAWDGTSPVLIN